MNLADEIHNLRDRTLARLNTAHDFYADTKIVWNVFEQSVKDGYQATYVNVVTGATSTADQLVIRAQEYLAHPLIEASYQQLLAIFESFVFDLLRLWLTAHPRSLAARSVDLRVILDAPDRDAILAGVIGRELIEVAYDRPAKWFAYLKSRVKLGCPSPDEVDRFTEAKARRDLIAHNQGIVNAAYLLKAGRFARFDLGDQVEIAEFEHRALWNLLGKMVADLGTALGDKAA